MDTAKEPVTLHTIWKHIHTDLERREQVIEILGNLSMANKIQAVKGGYLPVRKVMAAGVKGAIDWNILTENERNLI